MYLYGASGHAKVIIEILELLKLPVEGLFDDNESLQQLLGYPVGPYKDQFNALQSEMIISIGNNSIRKKIAESLSVNYGKAVHPFSHISPRAVLGEGTVVMGGVVINSDAQVGNHCIINTNASVDHDCLLGSFVHISPNAALCGNVTIGEGCHIGAGTVILPGVRIGKWCNIGAGAVVIRDVPDYSTAVGNPSKIIKTNLSI